VNKVIDNYIISNKNVSIPIGTNIYRNYNHKFEKQILNDKSRRIIDISIFVKNVRQNA